MGHAENNEFVNGRCPRCKNLGEWDYVMRQMKCRRCNISGPGITSDEQQEKAKPPTPQSADTVMDVYDVATLGGGIAKIFVLNDIPKLPEASVSKLDFSFRLGEFHRHRLAALHEQEKRWGRDHLRRLLDNKIVYDVVVDAMLVSNRQFRKPLEPDVTYSVQDIFDYLDEVHEFLAGNDTNEPETTIDQLEG